jgi:hypothetical protein
MSRSRRSLATLVVGLLALSPLTAAVGQGNEPVLDKYGWWNANQTLPEDPTGGALPPLEVPAPPGAPDDGIYVEVAASGTTLAIGGVNFFTGGGVDASLTLTLVEGSSPAGVTLAACPAGGGWDAAQNGRWDRRPPYEPKTCTFLGTARNNTVTFSIPAAAHEPGSAYLSLAIVPAEGSGTFAAAFRPPSSASLVTTPATSATPTPSASPAPALEPGPVTFGGDAYALPNVAAPTAAPTTTVPRERAAAPRATRNASDDDEQGSARVIAVLALVVIGGTMLVSTRRSQRGPRLIGSLGADATTEARDAA